MKRYSNQGAGSLFEDKLAYIDMIDTQSDRPQFGKLRNWIEYPKLPFQVTLVLHVCSVVHAERSKHNIYWWWMKTACGPYISYSRVLLYITRFYIYIFTFTSNYIYISYLICIYILYIPWKFFSISIMTNPSTISQLYIYQRKAFHFRW